MSRLGTDRYCAELPAETARLAVAVQAADSSRLVPTCPAWTLGQLTAHVGFGQRWAASIVEQRAMGPVPHDAVTDLEVPAGAEERSRWLETGARRLVNAVLEAGPETRVWSWAEEQTAGFWLRRITHDTLLHRIDAELAVNNPVAIAPDLAADSVSDLLDMFRVLPRVDDFPALAGLRGHGETLLFHATDPGLTTAEWLARRTQDGIEWAPQHGPSDVVVRGPASDLLLVLSRRVSLRTARLAVSGDRRLLDHWLDHSRLEPA